MDSAFEAFVVDDIDLVTPHASVRVRRGAYIVSVKHDRHGARDGARLTRLGFDAPSIRLTQAEYELLTRSRLFEPH